MIAVSKIYFVEIAVVKLIKELPQKPAFKDFLPPIKEDQSPI